MSAPAITVTGGDLLVVVVSGPQVGDAYNGRLTISAGGTFTLACVAGNGSSFTSTAAPIGTSLTLTAAWTDPTGHYPILFSDKETRYGDFTNGGTSVTWNTALTGSPTTSLSVGENASGTLAYYELNATSGSTTVTATDTTASIHGIYVAEYSGIATSGAFQGCSGGVIGSPGTTADAVTTGVISTASTPAELIGFVNEVQSGTSTDVVAGTGYTLRTPVYATWAHYGFPEDQAPTSGTSFHGTWTASGAQFDTYMSVMMAFAGTAGSSCTHNFWSSAGSFTQPNGTSGSYWNLATGTFSTPNCSTGSFWRQDGASAAN